MIEVALGFDLGGTALKYGIVTRGGQILASGAVPIEKERKMPGIRASIRAAAAAAQALASEHRVKPVVCGVGCAGTVVGTRGKLVTPSPNLPFMKDFEIARFLHQLTGLPAVAENDATVAALAEFRLGTGRGKTSLLMATVGTGLGGGLVVEGKLVRGRLGTAGEIGHGVFQPGGLPCPCGSRGCLEQYTARRALIREYRKAAGRQAKGRVLRVRDIITWALGGERAARRAVAVIGKNLGIGLETCASLVPVDVIAIGGGTSVLGDLLIGPARAAFLTHALPYVRKAVRITRAKLGNHAGLVGAALLAFEI